MCWFGVISFILFFLGFPFIFSSETRWVGVALTVPVVVFFIVRNRLLDQMRAAEHQRAKAFIEERNPSWPQVRATVIHLRGTTCSDCGTVARKVHVHHIKPVSLGGRNTLDNLVVLCESCHAKAHGRVAFSDDDEDDEDLYDRLHSSDYVNHGRAPHWRSEKAKILQEAVARKAVVVFEYLKPDAAHPEKRSVTPLELYSARGHAYLRAYCHLRKAERNFRLSRIKRILSQK